MIKSIILAVVLSLSSGLATAKPKIDLAHAIQIAKHHVAAQHLSTSGRYLGSVTWNEDFKAPEQSCWIVVWLPNEATTLDGQLIVRIRADGTVTHQDGLG